MEFNDYQILARSTALYTKGNEATVFSYPYLGLAGEAGEVCEKAKKLIRDGNGVVTPEYKASITKELGDVLWYLSNISTDLGITLEDVAKTNIEKLKSRKERDMLNGSGDNR